MSDPRENLERRVKAQVEFAKSGLIANLIIYAAIGIVLIGLAGIVWWKLKKSGAGAKLAAAAESMSGSATPKDVAWDGKAPFTCGGAEAPVLHDVVATAGVTASDSCKLTLKNVKITAPTAITAAGNATVTVEGGEITGADSALSAGGNATIEIKGAKVTGKTTKGGNGKLIGI
jgi:hypothetical protein